MTGTQNEVKSFMQQNATQECASSPNAHPDRRMHEHVGGLVEKLKSMGRKKKKVHSDTYIPVQPNLQPKPQAERSGRKKDRKKAQQCQ